MDKIGNDPSGLLSFVRRFLLSLGKAEEILADRVVIRPAGVYNFLAKLDLMLSFMSFFLPSGVALSIHFLSS